MFRSMRTTVTLADDVVAAVEQLRRERSIGMSQAVNELIRAGLTKPDTPASPFRQKSHDLGRGIDFDNITDTLETLDGPSSS
jgi:Ribbon-helix-helix protein, copG family